MHKLPGIVVIRVTDALRLAAAAMVLSALGCAGGELDPGKAKEVTALELPWAGEAALNLPYVYIVGDKGKIAVARVDAAAGTSELLDSVDVPSPQGETGPIALGDDALYVSWRDQLWTFDLSDPARPELASTLELHDNLNSGYVKTMERAGSRLYISVPGRGLRILDITSPLSPVIEAVDENSVLSFFTTDGDRIFGVVRTDGLGTDTQVEWYSLDDPLAPTLGGTFDGGGHSFSMSSTRLLSVGNITRAWDISGAEPIELGALGEWAAQPLVLDDTFYFMAGEQTKLRAATATEREGMLEVPLDCGIGHPTPGHDLKTDGRYLYAVYGYRGGNDANGWLSICG